MMQMMMMVMLMIIDVCMHDADNDDIDIEHVIIDDNTGHNSVIAYNRIFCSNLF